MREKMQPTIRDVARVAKVSIATVSHVVNESRAVKADTRQRVLEAISQTGYRHNVVARELKMGASGLIGVLIVDYNTFYTDVLRGIEDTVQGLNWRFVVASTGEQWERQRDLIQMMVARRMQGILVAPVEGFDSAYVREYVPKSISLMQFDRHAGDVFPSVSSENRAGAELLMAHLRDHGHLRVGFITAREDISSLRDRLEGLLDAARRWGMQVQVVAHSADPSGGYQGTKGLLVSSDPPTAIIAASNPILIGALRALREQGRRIGEDVAIVGFDDLPWCEVCDPPITVVHQSSYVMGQRAVEMLHSLIQGEEVSSESLTMELRVRGSCGCHWQWT